MLMNAMKVFKCLETDFSHVNDLIFACAFELDCVKKNV